MRKLSQEQIAEFNRLVTEFNESGEEPISGDIYYSGNGDNACMYIYFAKCRKCGTITNIPVVPGDFNAWQRGELIQNAFPYLSADQRELMVSGFCSDCWKKIFA